MISKLGSFTDEVLGEVLETGKSAAQQAVKMPGQIIKTAGRQISGKKPAAKPSKTPKGEKPPQMPAEQSAGFLKDYLPPAMPKEKIQQLKQAETIKQQQELDKTRADLNLMKIQRYQKLQQDVRQEQLVKEEISAAEQAQTGYRTFEEKAEWLEQKRVEEEEQKAKAKGPSLPSSGRKMPGLAGAIKAKQGSKEVKLGKIG